MHDGPVMDSNMKNLTLSTDPSVFSLILPGRASGHRKIWIDRLVIGSLVVELNLVTRHRRLVSCLPWRKRPTLALIAWKKADIFKINDGDVDNQLQVTFTRFIFSLIHSWIREKINLVNVT